VARLVQATKRMIHLLAPPRKIEARCSGFPMEMVRLSAASNMVKLLSLPVWLYVELRFLFFRYKALTLLTIGEGPDDRRWNTVFYRVSSRQFPGRRRDGHGFPVPNGG
jgi:hypothetical protein